jgi:membrane protease YdiL (CAAX protease family)
VHPFASLKENTFATLRGTGIPDADQHPVPRWKWGAALLAGTLLWFVGLIASEVIPQVLLGMELEGATYALVGLIRAALGAAAIVLALRIVNLRLRDVGLVATEWRRETLVGAAIAIVFALLQFLIIIPNTGGASRSDIVANAAQIGTSPWGVFGFIVLAWTGAFSEELFFRGHFFTTLRGLLGPSGIALGVTVALTVVLFAAGHGYQGWAGVVDTGMYGGLTLTLLYLWRRRLTACIVAHALWNTIATVVIYRWY